MSSRITRRRGGGEIPTSSNLIEAEEETKSVTEAMEVDNGEGENAYEDDIEELGDDEEDEEEEEEEENHLSPQETAAIQCRLPAKDLSPDEQRLYPDLVQNTTLKDPYVFVRNISCLMWIEDPQSQLVSDKVFEAVSNREEWYNLLETSGLISPPNNEDGRRILPMKLPSPANKTARHLVDQAVTFLERYGLINMGRFSVYRPALTQAPNNFKVVVIGAGVSGLIAARQLQYFGCQVTILESRDRIGGRVYTFKHNDYVADLGAMVVTGLGGNPVSILAKQMPIELAPIKTNCPLYSPYGALIGKEKDEPVEAEFNRLLTTAAHLCHSKGLDSLDGQPLSLGHTIEMLIKYQERHARHIKLKHLELQETLLNKLNTLLDQMSVVRKKIEIAHAAWSKADSYAKSLRSSKMSHIDTNKPRETFLVEGGAEFEARRLLRDLSKTWAELEPLNAEHRDIMKKLESLKANEPLDCYLTATDRQLLDWHLANLEFANASQLEHLSLKHWDQDDQYEFSGDHMVVANGYCALPTGLAEGLHVQLKTSVKNIRYNKEGVTVEAVNAALSEDDVVPYRADAVVCTLPLGVLKESLNNPQGSNAPQFDPPLPTWKTDAIKRLGYGNLNKVVLCFDRFFWDRQISLFGHLNENTADRGEFFLFWSLYEKPVLIALIAGRAAVEYERQCYTKDEIVARAMVVLRGIFSNNVPQPIGSYVTRWHSDPDSRGSYSYVAIGATGDDYDILAKPIAPPITEPDGSEEKPRIFFAGEHTNRRYPATVHGALLSGAYQAANIANTFFN